MFSERFFNRQIDRALKNAQVISTSVHKRIVLFSDCHRGTGNWSDSFLNNKTIYEAALTYYFNNGFTYIELGDGDELWENRRFSDIAEIHGDIFSLLGRFRDAGRIFMLWGNHAKSFLPLLNNPNHLILQSAHPSPFSAYNGFFGCKHFSKCNSYLVENGVTPID